MSRNRSCENRLTVQDAEQGDKLSVRFSIDPIVAAHHRIVNSAGREPRISEGRSQLLAVMAAGAPNHPLSELFGITALPARFHSVLLQSLTGVAAALFGLPAVLLFVAAGLIIGTILFLIYT